MIDLKSLHPMNRLDAVWTWLMGGMKPQKQRAEGKGVILARKRLAAKRAANADIPNGEWVSRQRRRYYERMVAKRDRIADGARRKTNPSLRPSWRAYQ